MLTNKRITIVADTTIDGVKIASYGAILDMTTGEVNLTSRNVDNHACKIHKDTVRKDRAEFEDSVYEIQDMLQGMFASEE